MQLEDDSNKLDLIILDLSMPNMNGLQVLRKIKSIVEARKIPIAVYSSANNTHNIFSINQLEANAFFEKPLDTAAFEEFFIGG